MPIKDRIVFNILQQNFVWLLEYDEHFVLPLRRVYISFHHTKLFWYVSADARAERGNRKLQAPGTAQDPADKDPVDWSDRGGKVQLL